VIELLPEPLSPLFATLALPAWNAAMRRLMRQLAPAFVRHEGFALVTLNGYAYYDYGLTAWQSLTLVLGLLLRCRRLGAALLDLHARGGQGVAGQRALHLDPLADAEIGKRARHAAFHEHRRGGRDDGLAGGREAERGSRHGFDDALQFGLAAAVPDFALERRRSAGDGEDTSTVCEGWTDWMPTIALAPRLVTCNCTSPGDTFSRNAPAASSAVLAEVPATAIVVPCDALWTRPITVAPDGDAGPLGDGDAGAPDPASEGAVGEELLPHAAVITARTTTEERTLRILPPWRARNRSRAAPRSVSNGKA
jgi:hypothetical protein